MNLIDNLANDEYILSDQDVLRARIRTTGISDSKFQLGKYTWKFFHRGGWSNNPRKFARNEYTSIVGVTFMAALDEWDVILPEDPTKTRLKGLLSD